MDFISEVEVARQQPVPFSHKHHVGDDGIDCRYCHTAVESSAFAGLPATQICMNCHSQIWLGSPLLEPVRQSMATSMPILWTRVYDLPDFVYFDHSIHLAKGVGCSTCHGRVDEMPLTRATNPMIMAFCLDCHRNPQRYLRPQGEIFSMDWQPGKDQDALGRRLAEQYRIKDSRALTSCSTCHR